MRRRLGQLALPLLICGVARAALAPAPSIDVQRYIAQQGWHAYQVRSTLKWPAADIAPVMYFAKDAAAPSCGLLSQTANAPAFIEILSAEAGEQYPQCLAINDVAAFDLNKKAYLVIEYINRDTADESFLEYFYVFKDAAGRYVADTALNEAVAASGPFKAKRASVNPPQAARGVGLAQCASGSAVARCRSRVTEKK